MNQVQLYRHEKPFVTESGTILHDLQIAYHTYGKLNKDQSNVVWVCHALTANSDVADWWNVVFGKNKLLDPEKYFIVCANNLGSCYGTQFKQTDSGNQSLSFNKIKLTTRDLVNAHHLLYAHLKLNKIFLIIGGSQGGQQAMEWAIKVPSSIEHMVLLACNAKHSAWGVAFNEAQRMAIDAGENGLKAARAIAMLSYRNYQMYHRTLDEQKEPDYHGTISYQQYQGEKLAKRFTTDSYYILSSVMDSHDVGRGRAGIENSLSLIIAKTLVIGISTDILFPISEQKFLASHIPNAKLKIISSPFGHDGFLTEGKKINKIVKSFLNYK
ncbi:MAG: homoserine O-acetyltransferase [Saprospiraceae bacterium]|nr:homoserine O-acetyltransferase [Candidatus Vicinibacter affinis]